MSSSLFCSIREPNRPNDQKQASRPAGVLHPAKQLFQKNPPHNRLFRAGQRGVAPLCQGPIAQRREKAFLLLHQADGDTIRQDLLPLAKRDHLDAEPLARDELVLSQAERTSVRRDGVHPLPVVPVEVQAQQGAAVDFGDKGGHPFSNSLLLLGIHKAVQLNSLMDKDNKDYIIADESLKQLFGQERLPISQLNMHLKLLIDNPDPLVIRHHLHQSQIQGFDVVVDWENNYQPELMPFLAQKVVTDESGEKKNSRPEHPFIQLNQKIKGLEKQIQKYVEQVKNHKTKRDAYHTYRKNPSLFLENLFLQQNAYLEMMQNEDEMKNEDPKSLKFLLKNQELVERQIRRYLEQQQQPQQQSQQHQLQQQQQQQQQQQSQ